MAESASRASLFGEGGAPSGAREREGGLVSTPFSDDSLLPKPAPAMPVSPHGDEYLLRSARAQWERRATVAADAASELKKAFNSLSAPIEANHFGGMHRGKPGLRGVPIRDFEAGAGVPRARNAGRTAQRAVSRQRDEFRRCRSTGSGRVCHVILLPPGLSVSLLAQFSV